MSNEVMENVSDVNQTQGEALSTPVEKMVPQSQVNEIVRRRTQEAAERAVENYKNEQQARRVEPVSSDNAYNSPAKGLSEDDVKRLTGEELERKREQWSREQQEKLDADQAQRIVDSYRRKIEPGREKYQDFEAVTNSVDMRYYPNVVQLLAEHVDNSHDVLYELAKDRRKLYDLESICSHNPADGVYEIKRLADSLKANEQVSNVRHPNAPLSQPRPSNTGTDSAPLSIRDYKRMYKG